MAESYQQILTQAVADLTQHGFDSADRIAYWQMRLKEAAERSLISASQMEQNLKDAMTAVYKRLVDGRQLERLHPGVGRFTIDRLKPRMQAELAKRIMASADLIRLNRQQSIAKTLQRFSGWASSIPAGGSKQVDRVKEKRHIKKALGSPTFEERRVLIDQGHKLIASINDIVASDGGAIALVWHSNWRQKNYNYRVDHKERDKVIYLLRDSWARRAGLVKPNDAGYYDEITAVAEEPFCRCYASYIYNLRDLPEDMITSKGREQLQKARERIARVT